MKVLYLASFHGRLDADLINAFLGLGHQVFDTGYWADPARPLPSEHSLGNAPALPRPDPALLAAFLAANPGRRPHGSVAVPDELVAWADVVVWAHCCPRPDILYGNWASISRRPVVAYTYAQQGPDVEAFLAQKKRAAGRRLLLVRNSPREGCLPGFAGRDAVIRASVDDEWFSGWAGPGPDEAPWVLTFQNHYPYRGAVSNTAAYEAAIAESGLPAALYGAESRGAPNYYGLATLRQQLALYRGCAVYFALGSKPATLTYNLVEAMLVGCPVVTWGKALGDDGSGTYEATHLFRHGEHLLFADSAGEAAAHLRWAAENQREAREMGLRARQSAGTYFGRAANLAAWREVLSRAVGAA